MNANTHFSIVTFGNPSYGRTRSFYLSRERAIADARALGGGSLSAVRVVACPTRREAIDADISGSHPVVWTR